MDTRSDDPRLRPTATASRRSRVGRLVRWVLVLALIAATGFVVYRYLPTQQTQQRGGRFARGNAGPIPVLGEAARRADVPIYLDAVGTVRPLNTVTVKPQVDGQLVAVTFREGQDVKKGDVLARIDPASYQAQLDQALAKKAQDEAQLANARRDLERYQTLAATNAVSKQQADAQRSTVAQLEALVKSDQAAIDAARTTLERATIIAPIDGRAGIRTVDVGNIVRAGDATGIVTLSQLKPISILFTVPQQQLSVINKGQEQAPLAVEAVGPDGQTVTDRGQLDVVDNQVDPTTGTVRLKAVFPNPDLSLWPGAFVNVRLLVETLKGVVVVPTAAVQRGPTGTFLYVVGEGGKVAMTSVTVGYQDDERSVVTKGVEAGAVVVTSGFAQISDGKEVRVSAPGEAPVVAPPSEAQRRDGQRQRRQGQGGKNESGQGGGRQRSGDAAGGAQ